MSKPFICSVCGERFVSVATFDQHRVGRVTDEHPHYGRSCLVPRDIAALGLLQDEQQRWYNPKTRSEAPYPTVEALEKPTEYSDTPDSSTT